MPLSLSLSLIRLSVLSTCREIPTDNVKALLLRVLHESNGLAVEARLLLEHLGEETDCVSILPLHPVTPWANNPVASTPIENQTKEMNDGEHEPGSLLVVKICDGYRHYCNRLSLGKRCEIQHKTTRAVEVYQKTAQNLDKHIQHMSTLFPPQNLIPPQPLPVFYKFPLYLNNRLAHALVNDDKHESAEKIFLQVSRSLLLAIVRTTYNRYIYIYLSLWDLSFLQQMLKADKFNVDCISTLSALPSSNRKLVLTETLESDQNRPEVWIAISHIFNSHNNQIRLKVASRAVETAERRRLLFVGDSIGFYDFASALVLKSQVFLEAEKYPNAMALLKLAKNASRDFALYKMIIELSLSLQAQPILSTILRSALNQMPHDPWMMALSAKVKLAFPSPDKASVREIYIRELLDQRKSLTLKTTDHQELEKGFGN